MAEKEIVITLECFDDRRYPLLRRIDYDTAESDVAHCHEFHELVLVLSGTGFHRTGGEEYPIYPGDVFVIPPRQEHSYRNLKKLSIANILFLREEFPAEFEELHAMLGYYVLFEADKSFPGVHRRHLTLTQENFSRAAEFILQMEQEALRKAPGWRFITKLLFFQLLALICRIFSAPEAARENETFKISRVLRFCRENYSRRLTLQELADAADISVSTLTRLFRQRMGRSPIASLNRLRLDRAATLLRETDLPVSRIAVLCGFCDSNYLAKSFSATFQLSPRAYRAAGRRSSERRGEPLRPAE